MVDLKTKKGGAESRRRPFFPEGDLRDQAVNGSTSTATVAAASNASVIGLGMMVVVFTALTSEKDAAIAGRA